MALPLVAAHDESKPHYADFQVQKEGFGFLSSLLDLIVAAPEIQNLPFEIEAGRVCGRPGYPPSCLLRAYLLKYLLNIRFTSALITALKSSAELQEICNLPIEVAESSTSICDGCAEFNREQCERGGVERACLCRKQQTFPSQSTFCRFYNTLLNYNDLLEGTIVRMVNVLRERVPGFGEEVIIDSTDIESYASPDREKIADPDARWGIRTKKRSRQPPVRRKKKAMPSEEEQKELGNLERDKEYFFGYKEHLLIAADTWTPLARNVLSANQTDMKTLIPLFQMAQEKYSWFGPDFLMADRGYDDSEHHRFLLDQGTIPVLHIRRQPGGGLHEGIYSTMGAPVCMGGKIMEYVKTDPDTGRHLYRCPPGGCSRRGKIKGWSTCFDSHWEDPNDNVRVIGVLPRVSAKWKRLYKRRGQVERHFSSKKRSRLLDKHQYIGKAKVELHVLLSNLTYVATSLARVLADDLDNVRVMKIDL